MRRGGKKKPKTSQLVDAQLIWGREDLDEGKEEGKGKERE